MSKNFGKKWNKKKERNRVAPDLIFSNLAGAGFGIADPAGAGAGDGAECS